jgi:hypothetical protein
MKVKDLLEILSVAAGCLFILPVLLLVTAMLSMKLGSMR